MVHAWLATWPRRIAAAALLLPAAAAVLWLPFAVGLPSSAFVLVVHIGVPSLMVMAAAVLAVWRSGTGAGGAVAVGLLLHFAAGVLLAVADVANVGAAMRGGLSAVAFVIWPSLLLIQWGRWLGWVPLPE